MQKATKENLTQLYIATFDRVPDSAGVDYWLDSGMSLEEIAQSFFDQEETKELYSDMNNEEFISRIYENVLERKADSEGLSYWKEQLDSGAVDRDTFILAIINGAQEHPEDAKIIDYKEEVGLYYLDADLNDAVLAKELIANMDFSDEGVAQAKERIETVKAEQNTLNNGVGAGAGMGGMHGGSGYEIATADDGIVSDPEQIESLKFMYQEEKLAGDVYDALAQEYGLRVFENIAKAEDVHMATIDQLLLDSGVDMSELHALGDGEFQDKELQSLYTSLIEKGSLSMKDALEVGVLVEETDIADLEDYLSDENIDKDMQVAYEHLLDGSYKHLDAFNSQLDMLDTM